MTGCVLLLRRYKALLTQVAQGLPALAVVPSPTEAQVIQALFDTAAEAAILTMRNKIEAVCFDLGQQVAKRDATAGMSGIQDAPVTCVMCLIALTSGPHGRYVYHLSFVAKPELLSLALSLAPRFAALCQPTVNARRCAIVLCSAGLHSAPHGAEASQQEVCQDHDTGRWPC